MADASPFAYDDTWAYARPPREQDPAKMSTIDALRAADELRAGPKTERPADPLRWAKGLLPEENKELPKPQFFMDPRATSLVNMVRGGIDTAANWLDGTKQPDRLKVEDMTGPLGGAGVMGVAARNLASKPTQGHLSGFIGPGQVDRLNLTPGSRGSLGALEKAQETWAKGGTDPGALAETWSKHGWAPPDTFGLRGNPFSWLQMPDLRLRDKIMDDHQGALARGEGRITSTTIGSGFEPGADLNRLLQASPKIANSAVEFKTGPDMAYNGAAGSRREDGRPHRVSDFSPNEEVPVANYYMAQGADPVKAESILIGHELRGHGMPERGYVGERTIAEQMAPRSPIQGTVAHAKLQRELAEAMAQRNGMTGSSIERSVADSWIKRLKEMQENAGRHASYFAMPRERLARHAHILDQLERGGANPFASKHAPGVMSTYGPRSLIDQDTFSQVVGNESLYSMRDLMPRVRSPFDLAPVD